MHHYTKEERLKIATIALAAFAVGGLLGMALHKETIVVRPNVADTPAAMSSVNVMIDSGSSTVRTWNSVSWHEAMSVVNLMQFLADTGNITLATANGTDGKPVVDAIDGVKNDATTRMRWQYWVNNVYEPSVASKYYLKPGDIVVWKYGKDQK